MVAALFDTNILIDHLNAVPQARDEIDRYDRKGISLISWIEVMVGAPPHAEDRTRAFLQEFSVVALDHEVAERTVQLRRHHRIKLPDAMIWASAQVSSMLLVTRNSRDYPVDDPGVRIPYQLQR